MLTTPRDDLVLETHAGDGTFTQASGPFTSYERTLTHDPARSVVRETTSYRYAIPWFAWLFALPFLVRRRAVALP